LEYLDHFGGIGGGALDADFSRMIPTSVFGASLETFVITGPKCQVDIH